ncbi:MAG: hypothetical protein M0D57_22425 [Sphingobacteriales bacterium JAD_PAG50586_3]|nr:MAG: hypothetical protein M0D57_22425 [Sphingobacteriales bacterium JAD_PAG50586_3]
MKVFYFIVAISILIISCKTNAASDDYSFNEKKYWRQRSAKLKKTFYYNYSTNSRVYPKNTQPVTTDTIKTAFVITVDSVRLYLFEDAIQFKTIFTSGLITPKDVYCGIGKDCGLHDEGWRYDDGSKRLDELWGFKGKYSTIDTFQEIKYFPTRAHRRRFVFHIPANQNTGFAVYLVELTNKKATTKTDLETFIKGATLTFYEYAWGEI